MNKSKRKNRNKKNRKRMEVVTIVSSDSDPGDTIGDDSDSQGEGQRERVVEQDDSDSATDDAGPAFNRQASESDVEEVMMRVYESESLKKEDIRCRERILRDLRSLLLGAFPSISLETYGSFLNGFGTQHSDLDISASFEDYSVLNGGGRKDLLRVLGLMTNLIKSSKQFQRAVLIRARIPIVRFWCKTNNFEGDISIENTFALANTQLLRTYADIDVRVKILGLFLKTVMKMCDLNDAANGGLSSYGFSILLIHYLQQVQPPVLPVLQEIHSDCDEALVADNDYTIFFRDLPNLGKVWPAMGKNTMSASELWIGFLKFYANFNFVGRIVSIRQSSPVSRVKNSKDFIRGCFAIEDPFDTTGRSVAKMVSRETTNYILKIFSFMIDANYASILEHLQSGYFRWRNGQKAALFNHHPRGMPVKDIEVKNTSRSGSKKHWQLHRANSRKMKQARLDQTSNRDHSSPDTTSTNNAKLSHQNPGQKVSPARQSRDLKRLQQPDSRANKDAALIAHLQRKFGRPHPRDEKPFPRGPHPNHLPPRLSAHLNSPRSNLASNSHNNQQFNHRQIPSHKWNGFNFQTVDHKKSHRSRR